MIQLLGIQTNGINQSGKLAAKEGEQTKGFEALLQLIGYKEEETESLVSGNEVLFLQQNPLMEPILKNISFENSPFAQTQGEQIIPKQDLNHPLKEYYVKELMPSDEKLGENELNPALFLEIKENTRAATIGSGPNTEETVKGLEGLTQNREDSDQNESQITVQTSKNVPVDSLTMVYSTPTNQAILSIEKAVPAQTVQANQFDQEVTKFLQSSIHVTGSEDGVEAAFTLAPKHLGKVDVKVTIQDGQVTAEFLTSTPLGKDLLESHVQTLRSALETQGLHVGKIDITQQSTTASNFLGHFSQKGDSQARQGQQESRRRNEQQLIQTQDEYRDYVTDSGWVSKINTTA